VVRGSGGLGAGFADVVHGDATAMHLGYHFSLSLNMCYSPASACAAGRLIDDADGAPSSLPQIPRGSASKSSTNELALQERLVHCFKQCPIDASFSHGACKCMCLTQEIPTIDCGHLDRPSWRPIIGRGDD
jgi:hypothetical protein